MVAGIKRNFPRRAINLTGVKCGGLRENIFPGQAFAV
jgi:hypothetical protein